MWWVELLNSFVSVLDSGGAAGGGGASFESIASFTAVGGETAVTFSSIPSTYKSLEIRLSAQAQTSTLNWRFNSDTGSNYAWHRIYATGGASGATGTASTIQIGGLTIPSAATGGWSSGVYSIIDYASTSKYKTLMSFGGYDANGSGYLALISGLWMNTNAISSIQLNFSNGDTLVAGSKFSLYGIKGA